MILSRYFNLTDLCQVGETWNRLAHQAQQSGEPAPANLPQHVDTLDSLAGLASGILDRVVDRFGPLEITYGFASPALTRHIDGQICPKLDQHAASEHGQKGAVCSRGGAAVDFRVVGVSSIEIARFITADLAWDRLYLYGDDRPLHVSWHASPARALVAMRRGPSGRLIPHPLSVARLAADSIRG